MIHLGMRIVSLTWFSMLTVSWACAQPRSPIDLDWLREDCGDGALVHHAEGRLYLTELSHGETVFLAPGHQPEFSPDGARIAWIDGTTAKGRLRSGENTIRLIANDVVPGGGVHWCDSQSVWLIRQKGGEPKSWFRVFLDGREEPCPELTALGTGGYECDVRRGEDRVYSYVAKVRWKTSDGRSGKVPGTCSVSLSPDGRSVTSLHNPHKKCSVTAIRRGGVERTLWWRFRGGYDNHRWSSNDERYLVCVDEHHQTMVVMTADGKRCTRMGTLGKARHGMYGDFTVGARRDVTWVESDGGTEDRARESSRNLDADRATPVFSWEGSGESNVLSQADGTPRLCRLLPSGRARVQRSGGLLLAEGEVRLESAMVGILAREWGNSPARSCELVFRIPRGASRSEAETPLLRLHKKSSETLGGSSFSETSEVSCELQLLLSGPKILVRNAGAVLEQKVRDLGNVDSDRWVHFVLRWKGRELEVIRDGDSSDVTRID